MISRLQLIQLTRASRRWFARAVLFIALPLVLTVLGVGQAMPAALAVPSASGDLTLSVLDQRIAEPIQQGDALVIDLRDFKINLRSDEATQSAFAEQFYQHLHQALNPKNPKGPRRLGLDLSGSLIQGELDLSKLSLRIPAYGEALLPELDTFKQTFQQPVVSAGSRPASMPSPLFPSLPQWTPERSPGLYSRRLSRFLITSARSLSLDTLAFQGPLLLDQTCFNGILNAADIYFLNRVEAQGAIFTQAARWQSAKFARSVNFNGAQFQQESSFRSALFASPVRFNQSLFGGASTWQGSTFYESASFAGTDFQSVIFAKAHWQRNADFDQARFHALSNFQQSRFDRALFLTDAALEGAISFRQAQFQAPISLRGAHVLTQLDFGDARFASGLGNSVSGKRLSRNGSSQAQAATINVANLDFSAGEARILGSPGQVGRLFSVPTLTSNETVLRNLIRNFRLLEQIGDANQLEYKLERLRLAQLTRQMLGTSLNQASQKTLVRLGLSPEQAMAVVSRAAEQPFVSRADLLSMDEIDLATYLRVRDRLTTRSTHLINRLQRLLRWLLLAGLLQISDYGTNVNLIFGVGLLVTTLFALMFWLVDRYRRLTPTPIVPGRAESVTMLLSGGGLLVLSLAVMLQSAQQPGQTLAVVGLLTLPAPGVMLIKLYREGRYHDLMERSYFVENGALRRLQVLITRLPVPPKFPFFRERYTPLLSDRKWNWLNYFDFSLNNWFKFGFNDIRLRDRCVPGLISTLVWYQWSLGIVYIALLLWTLSRTIPGLNLLLYF